MQQTLEKHKNIQIYRLLVNENRTGSKTEKLHKA
jgi:hypothetical protein